MWAKGWKHANVISMERIAKCIANYGWAPVVWKDGYRKQANFLRSDFCVLDFDSGEMSLEEARHSFVDMKCVIGTTKSHQKVKGDNPACDRFRVVFQWEETITDVRLYRYNMARIVNQYPVDKIRDAAHFFYPCTEIVYLFGDDGYKQEVIKTIPEYFDRKIEHHPDWSRVGVVPSSAKRMFTKTYGKYSRNKAIYGFAKDCAAVGLSIDRIVSEVENSDPFKEHEPLTREEILRAVGNGLKATNQ